MPVLNGKLECELRSIYSSMATLKSFLRQPGQHTATDSRRPEKPRGKSGKERGSKDSKRSLFSQRWRSAKPKGAASPVDAPATVTVLPGDRPADARRRPQSPAPTKRVPRGRSAK